MTQDALTPQRIQASFDAEGFVCSHEVAVALHLADRLGKPLLMEGPPGVGKTEIAKLWATTCGSKLLRLQCYEGLDEARALYEWSYGKQMLYTQLLRDKVSSLLAGTKTLSEALAALSGQADEFFSRDFLLPRPVLAAILSPEPVVLLIDEIDRSDEEFEAFLLEVLSDYQVSVPELGTLQAVHRPRVILTSNDSRDLSDALRRRCLFLYVDYPTSEQELRILERRASALAAVLRERVVHFVQAARKAGLTKPPGIAETVDWALALIAIGATGLGTDELRHTLGALLKNRADIEMVLTNASRFR